MPITLLLPRTEERTKYVVPKSHGIEERDVEAFPLPPNTSAALVEVVVDELRAQGHTVHVTWKRERLADWSKSRQMNQRSFGSEDGWQANPKGPVMLYFVSGGWDCRVVVDGVEHRLEAQHLRMPRNLLATILRGRP